MSQGRDKLTKLISSNQPISIYYWLTLLNLFEQYQTDLDTQDVRLLVTECERCRKDFNIEQTEPIRKEDTRPNIYSYLDVLEANENDNYNKESLPTTQLVAVAQ